MSTFRMSPHRLCLMDFKGSCINMCLSSFACPYVCVNPCPADCASRSPNEGALKPLLSQSGNVLSAEAVEKPDRMSEILCYTSSHTCFPTLTDCQSLVHTHTDTEARPINPFRHGLPLRSPPLKLRSLHLCRD